MELLIGGYYHVADLKEKPDIEAAIAERLATLKQDYDQGLVPYFAEKMQWTDEDPDGEGVYIHFTATVQTKEFIEEDTERHHQLEAIFLCGVTIYEEESAN